MEFNILLIDDDLEQKNLLEETIEEINGEDPDNKMILHYVGNKKEAIEELFRKDYDLVFVDLKLGNENIEGADEALEGNDILHTIINERILSVIVRSGFSDRVTEENKRENIKIISKDDNLYDVLNNFKDSYDKTIFSIFGSKGKIKEVAQKLFWNIIPKCLTYSKDEFSNLDESTKERVLIRYIASWISNAYMNGGDYNNLSQKQGDDRDGFDGSVEPIEMYMFPNPVQEVCTCDIFKDTKSDDFFIVLSPACDLANAKINKVLLCKIVEYSYVSAFYEKYKKIENEEQLSNKEESFLKKWIRNSELQSIKYHFLPKVSFFRGGFIDFRELVCVEYDKETKSIKGQNFKKVGVITDAFRKDIIARFSAYYHRQGQPEFNFKSIVSIDSK